MAEEIETETRWRVRDTADGLYLKVVPAARSRFDRPTARFVAADRASAFPTPEAAARAALLVPPDRFETVEFVEERVRIERRAEGLASRTLPPPRRFGTVPSSWIGATGSMAAHDLLETARVVEARRVDPRDIPSVVEIFEEIVGRPARPMR